MVMLIFVKVARFVETMRCKRKPPELTTKCHHLPEETITHAHTISDSCKEGNMNSFESVDSKGGLPAHTSFFSTPPALITFHSRYQLAQIRMISYTVIPISIHIFNVTMREKK